MKRLPFPVLNLLGLTAFLNPLLMAGEGAAERGSPWFLALLVPLLLAMAIAEIGQGTMDAKAIAMLGVLAACAALLRLPISFAGANLIFFMPIVAGFVFGPRFGFLLGASAMAVSALITGGIGPWLPFQMWGLAWVGAGAGLTGRMSETLRMNRLILLIGTGVVAALFYGIIMNLYFWPTAFRGDSPLGWQPGLGSATTVARFVRFYLTTSLAWDAVGAIANAILLGVLGIPVAEVLFRYRQKLTFETLPPIAMPDLSQPLQESPALTR